MNAKLLLTKAYTEGLCLMIQVSLRHMLEVILYTIVQELLEFGARRSSRGKQISRFKWKLGKFMHKKCHGQVLNTTDSNVHSKILNLMTNVC